MVGYAPSIDGAPGGQWLNLAAVDEALALIRTECSRVGGKVTLADGIDCLGVRFVVRLPRVDRRGLGP